MAGLYGDFVAKTVEVAFLPSVSTGGWVALQVGATPLKGRRHIRIQTRGAAGATIALTYVAVNADGTYTAPTGGAGNSPFIPGNSSVIEPIGDNITIYGRVILRAGATALEGGVVVTEYA